MPGRATAGLHARQFTSSLLGCVWRHARVPEWPWTTVMTGPPSRGRRPVAMARRHAEGAVDATATKGIAPFVWRGLIAVVPIAIG